ncbi:MAG: glycosyltransferase family 4 protein [Ignavibacteria bacterium]
MKNRLHLLHISPDFNYVCGVSKYIYLLLRELKNYDEVKLFFITNGGDSLQRLKDIGIYPYIMSFKKGLKNIFYVKKNLAELKRFCIENQINIIHTHHRYPELLANNLKRELNIKTITTVHSLVDGYRRLSFKSDKIIAVSTTVEKNLIEKFGVEKERIIQIYNPLDFNEYKNIDEPADRSLLGIPDDAKVFLFVGRWTKIKGVDILVKAFRKITNNYPKVYLILITDISETGKKRIQSINQNFVFIKPQRDISYFYKICDAIILPSRVESFPFVMLEAGLYKKIFIGSNVGGVGEFIEDGRDGLLIKKEDSNGLTNIIESVVKNLIDTQKLRTNLSNKVYSLLSLKEYSKSIINIYENLNEKN